MTPRQRVIAISVSAGAAALALAVWLIVALTGSSAPAPPSASPRSAALLSPFTGEPVPALGPVLAVKIDNIKQARPPTGLRSADIVYVLPVEGGLSRLMAVFSSRFPPVIGPVRSAREDDLELLAQFGRPAFAYSGATPHLLPFIHRARIVDLYAGTASGYFRDPRRVAPHNLYARSAALLAQAARREQGQRHRVPFRAAARGRAGRLVVLGVLSGGVVHLPLVGPGRPVAGVDGRRAGARDRGRPARRRDRDHPVHGHQDIAVP